jgi:N-acetylglucosamine kinase-like BadF-type ATPase
MSADYVVGLDAGNTKTIALLARADGTVVGSGRAGCGDIYNNPTPGHALEQMEKALTCALDAAGLTVAAVDAVCGSLAGADWPEDYALIRAELEARGLPTGEKLLIFNDALGALRAGAPGGVGVSVVCGTGAAIGARASDGRFWHTSWWQEPQGADQLGHKMLRAVYRAELGLAPPTRLTERVLAFYNLPDVEAVLHQRTARVPEAGPSVAQLARVLLDEAAAGDPVAHAIVVEHGAELGDYALVAARRLGLADGPFALVLAGGVLRHSSTLLRDTLIARVADAAPGVQPILSRFEPVVGALLFALEAHGVVIDERVLANLAASVPPATLFET